MNSGVALPRKAAFSAVSVSPDVEVFYSVGWVCTTLVHVGARVLPVPAKTGGTEGETHQKDYNAGAFSTGALPHRRDYYKSMESYGTGQVLS